jgi:TolB-like protein/Tfp pilus assembly protein PilF
VSFFAELKRRNVLKVGAAYLVVAWLLIQVIATLAPQLQLPTWVPRLVTLLLLAGFPVTLLMAWFLEHTDQGLRIDPAPVGSKRMVAVAVALAALALGWYWRGRSDTGDATTGARTIAVLPFVNMSGDPQYEYFSDGISEEILNVLARTPELRVAARTSSFAFKGKSQDIPDIARELKVRLVLEGSVRRQGDRVRITAQLIDATSGFHAWSQTYDRELADIFAIQDEIARAIGDELKVRIVGVAEGAVAPATAANLAAYDAYLRGLALWQTRDPDALLEAVGVFQQAISADPGHAPAYAGLALTYTVVADYTTRISSPDAQRLAAEAAEMALALDPALPETYAAMGNVAGVSGRRHAATALYRRAIALRPSFATAHQWLGTQLMSNGEPDAALAASTRAAQLDPRSRVVGQNLSVVLLTLGRYADARAECERILSLYPDYGDCLLQGGFAALLAGDVDAARARFLRLAEVKGDREAAVLAESVLAGVQGQGDRAGPARRLAAYESMSHRAPGSGTIFSGMETPSLLVLLREPELALDYLERIARERSHSPEWPFMVPALDPIRCDPRFVAALHSLGATDPRAARVCATTTGGAP